MSTKHVRTAVDLVRFGAGLRVECASCGNARTLDGFEVARTCGTKDFRQIMPGSNASRCGAKEAKLTVLSPPPSRE
jgi:hypothetical protein